MKSLKEAEKVAKEIVSRSPDAVAKAKHLYQATWVADEEYCLKVETKLQRQLIASWNQLAASSQNFGFKVPYITKKDSSLQLTTNARVLCMDSNVTLFLSHRQRRRV